MLEALVDRLVASDDFAAWFEGSRCVDPANSRPLPLFHGTVADDFDIFALSDDIGFHFGTAQVANTRLAHCAGDEALLPESRLLPVFLRARNPLRIRDQHTWDPANLADALVDAGVWGSETAAWVFDEFEMELDLMMKAALEIAGYDAIVYANESEDRERRSDSWIVWDPRLVKGAFARSWDRDDPRLLPGAARDPRRAGRDLADLRRARNDRMEIEESRRLLGEGVGASMVANLSV